MTLDLESKIKLDAETVKAPNLTDRFSDRDLSAIGNEVYTGYIRDRASRSKWERRTQAAMDLAMQVQKDKNFPWPGASNIAFPLVTIAALQFHSRAYPALLNSNDVVKCRVLGDDPMGRKTQRAARVSAHMSWQVTEQDQAWVQNHDRLLINLPIVGCTFKKTRYAADKAYTCGETVLAQDLVVDYWTKSLDTCPRKTHLIPLFRNQVHERILRKTFKDVREESWYKGPQNPAQTTVSLQIDNRQGITVPAADDSTPFMFLEQHVDMDLDGDGFAEPYIITVEENSRTVVRIVTGFDQEEDIERTPDGEIITIRRLEYFTKYTFIPSPDGGFYDVGFGVLLGPLNESTNSIINQLVDAGTMQNTKGGFLGRGAKIRGGVYTFSPLEWKRVDSTGDDLRKNIVPLEVGEPSTVLLSLLSLLINYVNRVAGTTDPMVGESPGQNTTAETMRTMVQQGSQIYSAIFKRVWECMKHEFKLRYIFNGIYMPARDSYGAGKLARREDYLGNPDDIAPGADPNLTSENAQMVQVQFLASRASTTPGYDADAVERRLLKVMKVDGIDQIYPGVKKTGAPKDIKIQIQEMKMQMAAAELEGEMMRFQLQLQEEVRMNTAEILKIAAEIENAKVVNEGDKADRQVAILQSIMKMLDGRNKQALSQLDIVKKKLEIRREQVKASAPDAGNAGGLERASGNGGALQGAETEEGVAA